MSNKDLHDKDIDDLLDGYGKQVKPDDNARKIALNLALAEFDRAQSGSKAGQNRAAQKKSIKSQGAGFFSRLIGRPTREERTPLMQASQKAYLAIGGSLVALVAVVGYIGQPLMGGTAQTSPATANQAPAMQVAMGDKNASAAAPGSADEAPQPAGDAAPMVVARLDEPRDNATADRDAELKRQAMIQQIAKIRDSGSSLITSNDLHQFDLPEEFNVQTEATGDVDPFTGNSYVVNPLADDGHYDLSDPQHQMAVMDAQIEAEGKGELAQARHEQSKTEQETQMLDAHSNPDREERIKSEIKEAMIKDPKLAMAAFGNMGVDAQGNVMATPETANSPLFDYAVPKDAAMAQGGGAASVPSGVAPAEPIEMARNMPAPMTVPETAKSPLFGFVAPKKAEQAPGRVDSSTFPEAEPFAPPPVPMHPPYMHDKPRVSDDRLMEIERVQRRMALEELPPELRGNVIAPAPTPEPVVEPGSRDRFKAFVENQMKAVNQQPVSTFSVDVDTSSYSFTRRVIEQSHRLPQQGAVRIEELVNYFDYNYPVPDSLETPFSTSVAITDSPWAEGRKLMHLGIKGYQLPASEWPNSNLVFLIDVSGSMHSHDKLPLLQRSLNKLVDTLGANDRVAIVVYAGAAGTVLPPTRASNREVIKDAISRLRSGGSTAGAQGIRQAYALAKANFDPEVSNRVILATDGDFNVGISNTDQLKSYIEKERESGVFLSVLGFGQGNLNDELMQALAQNGNGTAAYIDSDKEADKVLVREAGATLFTIAKDVKLQLEFNPAKVAEYRLIGYETRALRKEDFDNDRIDAGDIGAGHTVTAIYEFTPVGGPLAMAPSRYTPVVETVAEVSPAMADEYAFLKIRYKRPDEDVSNLITRPITEDEVVAMGAVDCGEESDCTQSANDDVRFATAVAGFGQLLRHGRYTGRFGYDQVIDMAQGAVGADPYGDRKDFVALVRKARNIAMPHRRYRD